MRFTSWLCGVSGLLLASAATGCSYGDMQAVEVTKTNVIQRYTGYANSPVANGRYANGRFANGRFANGRFANGTLVQGYEEEDHPVLEFVEIDTGTVGNGAGLVNMEFDGAMSDGNTQRLKVYQFNNTLVPGMELYMVKYLTGPDAGQSVCGDKDGEPLWASLVPDRFDMNSAAEVSADPNQFTFACRFGAIQKCQEYGYPKNEKRWEDFSGQSSRRRLVTDYHAACTRMVRADYCGDGVAHTFDGTSIDIYDTLRGGNTVSTSGTGADGFYVEADWEKDGAHCISRTRWMNNGLSGLSGNRSLANDDFKYIRDNCPERLAFSVTKLDGNPSVPDRNCAASNFNSLAGFQMYSSDWANQNGRAMIRNNSLLNVHAE